MLEVLGQQDQLGEVEEKEEMGGQQDEAFTGEPAHK
jgi:hypothetical protein